MNLMLSSKRYLNYKKATKFLLYKNVYFHRFSLEFTTPGSNLKLTKKDNFYQTSVELSKINWNLSATVNFVLTK